MVFEEFIIPKFVWKFVKKIVDNPIKAGIVAFLIFKILKGQKVLGDNDA